MNGDILATHKEKRKRPRQRDKELGQKKKVTEQKEKNWLKQIFFIDNLRPIT